MAKKAAEKTVVKETTAKVTKEVSFKDEVLAHHNKDEKTLQDEVISDCIEDYKIELKSIISEITVTEIPTLERKIAKAERRLVVADKAALEAELLLIPGNFDNYITNIISKNSAMEEIQRNLHSLNEEISSCNARKRDFTTLLKRISK